MHILGKGSKKSLSYGQTTNAPPFVLFKKKPFFLIFCLCRFVKNVQVCCTTSLTIYPAMFSPQLHSYPNYHSNRRNMNSLVLVFFFFTHLFTDGPSKVSLEHGKSVFNCFPLDNPTLESETIPSWSKALSPTSEGWKKVKTKDRSWYHWLITKTGTEKETTYHDYKYDKGVWMSGLQSRREGRQPWQLDVLN